MPSGCAPAPRRPSRCRARPSPCSRPASGSAGCSTSCRSRGRRRAASAGRGGRTCSANCAEALVPRRTPSSGITSLTRSRPTMLGAGLRPCATSEASSRSVVESTPVIAPRTRSRRTSARVSIPSMPMTLLAFRYASRSRSRAEVARHAGQLADDEARRPAAGATRASSAVDAVVADERVGHRDDLAVVGRVGEHLLVAGHAGVEDDLAEASRRRRRTPRPV